jgi:hypothetical protein
MVVVLFFFTPHSLALFQEYQALAAAPSRAGGFAIGVAVRPRPPSPPSAHAARAPRAHPLNAPRDGMPSVGAIKGVVGHGVG